MPVQFSAVELLFPKMYYFIALYQIIVELWCRATNFPNAPRKECLFADDTAIYLTIGGEDDSNML